MLYHGTQEINSVCQYENDKTLIHKTKAGLKNYSLESDCIN